MTITPEEIKHVADLARLNIDPESIRKIGDQMAAILDYVAALDEVDTRDVPPTSHAIELTNAFRSDTAHDHLTPEQALANAPQQENGFFVVPRVI
jgi:aspartyl-tRNA(Asn)/glutamyl-tRNA(Gln) amidotransferase subunit C